MARSMVLGNGNTLVCLDKFGQVRDFYFPYVGQENHVGSNQAHKIGVFVDGSIHWVDNGDWDSDVSFEKHSMVGDVKIKNDKIQVSIHSSDVVYNEKNIFLRRVTITNHSSNSRLVKLFLNQQFKIGDTNHADTAYFAGVLDSIIHYKGRRVFLVGGRCEDKYFDDYSIGFCGIEGKEGTWKDAEDGLLSKNPIEHGVVDSVMGWGRNLEPNSSVVVYYWIIAGETYKEVQSLLEYLVIKTPEHLIESTRDFWRAWANQVDISFDGLSEKVKNLFYDSLFMIRAHTDNNGGILASADSGNVQYGGDTYVYVWPRDACFTAMTFDMAGFHDLSKRFYNFASDVLTDDGYILHKYQPDRSLGSSWHPWIKDGKKQLAIQEDETAILLLGLWEHYAKSKDLEFIEGIYNSFIKKAANFMIWYKDTKTGLPLPSYDLWEEKHVVSVFTSSLVYQALISAYNFAKTLGKDDDAKVFISEADLIKKGIISILWDEDSKCFYKLVGDGLEKDQNLDASSFYGAFKFGLFSVDDERLKNFFNIITTRLTRGNKIGGYARYEGDAYYRANKEESVGNPWFIVSLWFAQYKIAIANSEEELKKASEDLEWVAKFSNNSTLGEQLNPDTGETLSAKPLVWSHAEFIRTVIEYQNKLKSIRNTN